MANSTIKFPQEMPPAATINGSDKIMIADAATNEAKSATWDSAKQYLNITGIELKPVPAGALPAGPAGEVRKMQITEAGTWTSAGSATSPFVNPDGSVMILWWDGSTWSIADQYSLPTVQGVDVLNPDGQGIPTEEAVANYTIPKESERILPFGCEITDFDRPDLDISVDLISISKEGFVISENWDLDYSMLKDYHFDDFDRPDLGSVIEVDSNYLIMSSENSSGSKSQIYDSDILPFFSSKYYEPKEQEEFESSTVYDYNLLISEWDEIMDKGNQGLYQYITKTNLGKSSTKDMDVFCYEFKPENPKYKILVNTGMHASEKIYIHILPKWFNDLASGWKDNSLMQWMRLNVHFIVIPCLSPSCMEGNDPGSSGGRRVHETTPIPITWTNENGVGTITYNIADFPDTDGRLDAANYFSNQNIVGKTWISVFESVGAGMSGRRSYVVRSIINGNTITVDSGNQTSGSGTAKMFVGVDINRNMQADGSTVWNNFITTPTSATVYSNDYGVSSPNDNKGTKPFSLNESIILKNLLETNSDILFYVDLHSGAGDNYLHWNTRSEPGQEKAIEEVKEHQSIYNNSGYSRVVRDSLNIPYTYLFSIQQINKQGYSLEWSQTPLTTRKMATDAYRWLSTFLISFTRNLNKF